MRKCCISPCCQKQRHNDLFQYLQVPHKEAPWGLSVSSILFIETSQGLRLLCLLTKFYLNFSWHLSKFPFWEYSLHECHGVWNHQQRDCSFNRFLKLTPKKTSKLCISGTFVRGIHWSPLDSPHKGPVMQIVFPWHDISMEFPNLFHPTLWEFHGNDRQTLDYITVTS